MKSCLHSFPRILMSLTSILISLLSGNSMISPSSKRNDNPMDSPDFQIASIVVVSIVVDFAIASSRVTFVPLASISTCFAIVFVVLNCLIIVEDTYSLLCFYNVCYAFAIAANLFSSCYLEMSFCFFQLRVLFRESFYKICIYDHIVILILHHPLLLLLAITVDSLYWVLPFLMIWVSRIVGLFDTAMISPGSGLYTSTSGNSSGNTGWSIPGWGLKFSISDSVLIDW